MHSATVPATFLSPAFIPAMVLYVIASVGFVGYFAKTPRWLLTVAQASLIGGFLCHGVDIGWRGVLHWHPGMSVREALGFLSWVFVAVYLLMVWKARLRLIGAFVAPLACVLLALARLSPSQVVSPSGSHAGAGSHAGDMAQSIGLLGRIHISFATVGVAVFCGAMVSSIGYLLQNRTLREKRFDSTFFTKGSSVNVLDKVGHTLVLVGFPIYTVAMILGVVWVARLPGGVFRVEYVFAIVTWACLATVLIGRSALHWRGRKASWLTIAGCSVALLVFALYFVRKSGLYG